MRDSIQFVFKGAATREVFHNSDLVKKIIIKERLQIRCLSSVNVTTKKNSREQVPAQPQGSLQQFPCPAFGPVHITAN